MLNRAPFLAMETLQWLANRKRLRRLGKAPACSQKVAVTGRILGGEKICDRARHTRNALLPASGSAGVSRRRVGEPETATT